ncbi:acetyltransferase [Bacillus sp. FJAT-27916]|uniref:acetyltransferase n=1 Tax=Bacillus sp. FJAT-27916 TaxID=1679169 RepID=UPI000670762C|nr:acetyltransferase [Bacillus sp. FJAT-27916]KMY46266.1 acetyltransferase [Bacillus sp. FJAT-27916]
MKDKLLIIGASGHGRVVADIALKMNKWKTIAFLDDDLNIKASMGIEVIGTTKDILTYVKDFDIFVGLGNNGTRRKIQEILVASGASIPIIVHPNAVIGTQVKLGEGTTVMAGAVINCCTEIGQGCIVNTGSSIDHDTIIEDYVHISPGVHLAGAVKIGRDSWIGIGSTVINNITITSRCKIGAGAVVIKDITEPGTYIGVPARRI